MGGRKGMESPNTLVPKGVSEGDVIKGYVRVRAGARTYRIPVDKDGMVPREAIIERYQSVGSRADRSRTSEIVIPARCTPEQIKDWWKNPASCDVCDVDTKDPEIYKCPPSIKGRKRAALSKIAVVADRKEADRIRTILADRFTADELERMSCGGSLIITTKQYTPSCTGYYLRVQTGVVVPRIVYEVGTTPDGIVHEAVHHLRAVEGRSEFPTTSSGKLSEKAYRSMGRDGRRAATQREEVMTVLETIARTSEDPVQSGYYDNVKGKTPRGAYLEDRQILTGGKALKGAAVRKAIAERGYDTNIAASLKADYNKRSKTR